MPQGSAQQKKMFVKFFTDFFKEHKITAAMFEKLQFLNEEYVINKVHNSNQKQGARDIASPMKQLYDAKAVFKTYTQNDQSLFFQNPDEDMADDQMDLNGIDTKMVDDFQ